MDGPEYKRMAESVEAGLREGRTLDSLRRAIKESGYSDEDVKEIIKHVDRKNTIRRPQRKKEIDYSKLVAAISLIAVIIMGGYILLNPSQQDAGTDITAPPNQSEIRTCYVLNETIRDMMIDAGAKCDRWYLIKEI